MRGVIVSAIKRRRKNERNAHSPRQPSPRNNTDFSLCGLKFHICRLISSSNHLAHAEHVVTGTSRGETGGQGDDGWMVGCAGTKA